MSNLYREPSIDANYQVSDHLDKRFQRRRILKISQSETSHLWRPCLSMDWDEMSNLYRGPSIDSSYQHSEHMNKWFQRRRILEIEQSETRIACGGHVYRGLPIDASYQVTIHLTYRFQRRFLKISNICIQITAF